MQKVKSLYLTGIKMAAKGDQPASGKEKPFPVAVHSASSLKTSPMRLNVVSLVGSGKSPPSLLSKTSPGTVLVAPQGKASSGGAKKAVKTKPAKKATEQSPPQNIATLPSKYKVSKPERMFTRSRGEVRPKEKPPASSKRKPAKRGHTDSDKGTCPKKSKISVNTKVKETSVSKPKTVTVIPKSEVSEQTSPDTSQVLPKQTVQPQTSSSTVKGKKGSGKVDIKVKFTPSESLNDHSYHATLQDGNRVKELREKVLKDRKAKRFDATYSSREVQELSEQAHKDAKMVEKLTRDRKMLRMRVFRANKKIEKLMRTIELEQKMHKETHETLQAIMKGLQLQVKTV